MGKRINPATVGAFVLGGIGLILVAIVVFGSGSLFTKTHEFVIYFGGDINGLRVGAPVKFKGVEIGQVSRIRLRLEQDINQQNGQLKADVRIPVVISLDEEKIVSHGGAAIDLSDPHTVPNLIREGLRAALLDLVVADAGDRDRSIELIEPDSRAGHHDLAEFLRVGEFGRGSIRGLGREPVARQQGKGQHGQPRQGPGGREGVN